MATKSKNPIQPLNPKTKGSFTRTAKKAGQTVLQHAHEVMANPKATTLQKRRANFAIVSRGWNHKGGGRKAGSKSGGKKK